MELCDRTPDITHRHLTNLVLRYYVGKKSLGDTGISICDRPVQDHTICLSNFEGVTYFIVSSRCMDTLAPAIARVVGT